MSAAAFTQHPVPYGARQLKAYIPKSTYRAFAITIILYTTVFAIAFILMKIFAPIPIKEIFIDHEPIPIGQYPLPTPVAPGNPGSGPASHAVAATSGGIPTPSSDPVIDETFPDPFGIGGPLGDPFEIPGGELPGNGGPNGPGPDTQAGTIAQTPDAWEFIAVEKEPQPDMSMLQRNIVYPDMAKKAGIEGVVNVRALIGKDGKVKEAFIISSAHPMLGDAALSAVLRTAFSPAVQNAETIACWISIPISFKLH